MQEVLRVIGENRDVGFWVAARQQTKAMIVSAYARDHHASADDALRAAQRIIAGFSPLRNRMGDEPEVRCLQADRRSDWTAQVRFVVEAVGAWGNKKGPAGA